jgi:hypothetical protein
MCRVIIEWMALAVRISTGDRPPQWIIILCKSPTASTHLTLYPKITVIKGARDTKTPN